MQCERRTEVSGYTVGIRFTSGRTASVSVVSVVSGVSAGRRRLRSLGSGSGLWCLAVRGSWIWCLAVRRRNGFGGVGISLVVIIVPFAIVVGILADGQIFIIIVIRVIASRLKQGHCQCQVGRGTNRLTLVSVLAGAV